MSQATADMDDEGLNEVARALGTALHAQRTKLGPFGAVKPIISTLWKSRRVVAVGSSILIGDWPRFIDFLIGYLPTTLGPGWMQAEHVRPIEDRNPILAWWEQLSKAGDVPERIHAVAAGGTACFRFAYDLYTLEHHGCLEPVLLNRLRQRSQFQGARYELWAAATCVRAGCTVTFEDESDRSTKHCEFTAVHEETGQRLSVEAKSKVRSGVKGAPGERRDPGGRPRIGRLLNEAAKKPLPNPAVFFVDLTLPAMPALSERDTAMRKIAMSVERTAGEQEPWSLLVLSNHAEEWDERAHELRPSRPLTVLPRNPRRRDCSQDALAAIIHACDLAGSIPVEFP